jgi:hypothetical protein
MSQLRVSKKGQTRVGYAQNIRREVETFLADICEDTERNAYFDRLIHLHERCKQENLEEAAEDLREAFLLALPNASSIVQKPHFSTFLSEQFAPSDFAKLKWQSPERVMKFCEILYAIPFPHDQAAERVQSYVSILLQQSLHQLEENGDYEQMLHFLQTAPTSPGLLNGELLRLRNRVHLYEMHRVKRHQQLLYGYLIVQTLFVIIIFPLLFVYAENGAIRDAVREATDVEIPEKASRQYLSYSDGLYWSVITATSIGYGDVTPRSNEGRIIAMVLGTMGVLTIGILAGLILNWITPRQLD